MLSFFHCSMSWTTKDFHFYLSVQQSIYTLRCVNGCSMIPWWSVWGDCWHISFTSCKLLWCMHIECGRLKRWILWVWHDCLHFSAWLSIENSIIFLFIHVNYNSEYVWLNLEMVYFMFLLGKLYFIKMSICLKYPFSLCLLKIVPISWYLIFYKYISGSKADVSCS
jgi:hypothetical protein